MSSNNLPEYFCPECKSKFSEKQTCFPFCSERCKLIDLGAWAQEQYRIPENPLNSSGQIPAQDSERRADSQDDGEVQ